MEEVSLGRYIDAGKLDSGADYEVRAAVDRETGQQVVLKRPVPQMVSRQMHGGTEARTDRTLQVYREVGYSIPGMVPILGYTDRAVHDGYFGESLGQEYRITVEERAAGIPLFIGDSKARITRVPVGAAQNLFALFALVRPDCHPAFPIHRQLLDVEERFNDAGYLLLDLRPQNIFFQPSTGQITVIDYGGLETKDSEPGSPRKKFQDIHDFFLEMLKFYTSPEKPPAEADGYRDPYGLRPVVRFEEELDKMAQNFGATEGPIRDGALSMIRKVHDRSYASIDHFRGDLVAYLEAVAECNSELPKEAPERLAWYEALDWLRGEYWRRYLFDPDTDLAVFYT